MKLNTGIKLWLDDERPAPKNWTHVKTVQEAKTLILQGIVTHISLDHDLGTPETGYDLAKWIEEQAYNGLYFISCECHSMNPVGAKNINLALQNANKYWEK